MKFYSVLLRSALFRSAAIIIGSLIILLRVLFVSLSNEYFFAMLMTVIVTGLIGLMVTDFVLTVKEISNTKHSMFYLTSHSQSEIVSVQVLRFFLLNLILSLIFIAWMKFGLFPEMDTLIRETNIQNQIIGLTFLSLLSMNFVLIEYVGFFSLISVFTKSNSIIGKMNKVVKWGLAFISLSIISSLLHRLIESIINLSESLESLTLFDYASTVADAINKANDTVTPLLWQGLFIATIFIAIYIPLVIYIKTKKYDV